MKRLCALLPCLLVAGGFSAATAAEPVPPERAPSPEPDPGEDSISILSLNPGFRFDADLQTGTYSATNGVQVRFRDAILTARTIQLDEATGDTMAEGGVTLERAGQTWTGARLRYNLRSGAMAAEEYKLGVQPIFVAGERAISLEPVGTNRVFGLSNSYLTSDDLAEPFFRIRARSLTIREDRRIVAKDAVFYVGETPVFWWPYYTRRFGHHQNRWVMTPGYRSLDGAYLRSAYEFNVTTNVFASLHFDSFTRRGFGMGPDIAYDLGQAGAGELKGYWIADQRPGTDPNTDEKIDPQRERISFDHRVTLRPGLTGTAVVRQQSDRWVIRDFFEDEFRRNPLPDTHFEVEQTWPDFTLNALARVQVNEFFETVERLPDVKLSAHRQELGQSGIFYEGENSAGWFQHRFPSGASTNEYSAVRADTFHQLLLPKTFFGWLNVTPRAGGRLTHYGETQSDGWESLDSETRGVFNTGAEVSFKAHRVWKNTANRFWDIDGLRHIVEPSINYAYTPEPNARPLDLPQFDTVLPSLRLLPVQYPSYNAIDSVDAQNVARLGIRNKLQTKRGGEVEDILDWSVITDWRLDPEGNQGSFGDIYSEADFRPRRWLTLNSEVRVDPTEALLRESHTSAIFKPGSDWSFGVTHRYTRDDDRLGAGGNLVGTRLHLRFSENWGFRTSHYYEVREGLLEEQYYTVYRDLRSITAGLTLRFRESVGADDDFTIAVSISLKAFPRFKTGQDAERPSLLIGG